ncbi:glycoside hydrolase family 26 protein, partial [Piromyces sp. E2]
AIEKVSNKILIEAEDGILSNKLSIFNKVNGYSGKGYVGKFETDEDILTLKINTTIKGFYNLTVSYLANSGTKTNEIIINNVDSIKYEFIANSRFEEIYIGTFYFNEGENTIEFKKDWGWMYIDYFTIEKVPDESMKLDYTKIDRNLVNANATSSAIKLYNFLLDNYGKRIISGQTGKAGGFGDEDPDREIDHIYKVSGKKPALWNTDFIFKSKDVRERFSTNNYMNDGLNWWKKYDGKGIMSIQWHWNMKGQKDENYSFYSKDTTFNIEEAIITNTWEYNKTIEDIDYIAGLLKELQDVNMPVIFRPLHENDGNWFWWGGTNHSRACAKLWKLLYRRLVEIHKINNIIWLWNGKIDRYTPTEYIDLVGIDIYSNIHGIHRNQFVKYFEFFQGKKMVVLSENGRIPDIDKCVEQGVWWGYFMTWNNEFILSDEFNDNDYIKRVYNSKYVITMDDL